MRERLRRGMLAALALLAAGALLSGCLYAQIPEAASPKTDKPAAGPAVPGFESYYSQKLDWQKCGSFQCATLRAPLNWSDASDGDVDIALIRQTARSGTAKGSLLVNPGGPGASGIGMVRDGIAGIVGSSVQQDYDIVGFDPRGVGESTSVHCLDAKRMDAFLYDIPQSARGSEAWQKEMQQRAKDFAGACDENSGGILPYITTDNAARDMDLMRGVLGDAKLNYLGYSYGTFLGATYAKLFPDRAGRLVLDGAIDPSVPGYEVGLIQAQGFESSLRSYMADCLGSRGCPFQGTVDQAMQDLSDLLSVVDAKPITVRDGRRLGGGALFTAIVVSLYSQDSWPYLTQALSGVSQGNGETAMLLADFYNNRNSVTGKYDANSTEAFNAYNCMDYPDDEVSDAELAARLKQIAPTVAPYWEGVDVCAQWWYPPTGVREKITAPGADPIVVVGTTGDPATPYEWSVSLADQLSSGVLITRVGEGHTGYMKGNDCVDSAVDAYFLEGTVPQHGLRCG